MTYARRLVLVLALAGALLVACEKEAAAPTAPASVSPVATASGSSTASGSPTAVSTAGTSAPVTSTPGAGTEAPAAGTPATIPTPQQTPEPLGPVTSTFTIPTSELPVVRFTAGNGRTADLPLEVPPEDEYGIGLSGRASLEGRGMLFYYPDESGGPGFWMRGTFIDLDIAFVALDGTIIQVVRMQAETEDVHHPGRAYLAGIEAPSGWYAGHGIAAGDRFEFLFDPDEALGLD